MRIIIAGLGEGPTPRELDHGWWNCDGCRELCHSANLSRVKENLYQDVLGAYFTLEYVKDMLKWLEIREDYEDACKVRDFITKWKESIKTGLDIPESKFY